MSSTVWFVICGGSGVAAAHPLEHNKYLIGRSDQCDIRILHRSVSRRHATVTHEAAGLTIRDLGSTNGTFLNRNRIMQAPAMAGDLLHFGRVAVELLHEQPDQRKVADDQIETDSADDAAGTALLVPGFEASRQNVLQLLLQGLSEKQVAVQLHMKQHTVHWHVKEIYTSLGVHSHAELCAHCHRLKGFGQE